MTREAYFDNAKFLLIFLVVFGHLIQSYIKDYEIVLTLYKVIYTFHMPAFILIAGFFSKGFKKEGYIKNLSKKLLIPYCIFQLVYSIYYYFLYDRSSFVIDPLNPHWSLWFLISLFFWNGMLFIFSKWKPQIAITIAVMLALLVGYIDWVSNYLSLSRTFVFYPFFLIGYFLNKEFFYKLLTYKTKLLSLLIITLVAVFFALFPELNEKWLFGSKSYAEIGAPGLEGLINRLFLFGISFTMVLSFLAFVPTQRVFFTSLGKYTLYVYLLHGFIIRTFRASDLKYEFDSQEKILSLFGIALVITILLSTKAVTSFFQPIIELKLNRFKQFVHNVKESIFLNGSKDITDSK